jgi:hypothetical protein
MLSGSAANTALESKHPVADWKHHDRRRLSADDSGDRKASAEKHR